MKSLSDIINSDPVFINDWTDCTEAVIFNEFGPERGYYFDENDKTNSDRYNQFKETGKILFASYGNANYSGAAFALVTVEGKLFEVNGSHCSCYGLEDQWELEEVEPEHLRFRLTNGTFGIDDWSDNNFRKELIQFLGLEDEIGD